MTERYKMRFDFYNLFSTRLLSLSLVVLLLSACAGPQAIITQDPGIDVTAYRSFGFNDPLSIEDADVRDKLSELLVQSTTAELESRGLTHSAEPDIRIDFSVKPPPKKTHKDRNPSPAPINSGLGRSSGWSRDSRDLDYSLQQTPKDTVTLNVIDRKLEQVAWSAEVREYVTWDSGDKLFAAVSNVVAVLLAEYPVALPGDKSGSE